jgi:hypothetical protein
MMACSTKFLKSIVLPDGDKLATLQDAGAFITKTLQDIARWQNAMHVLIRATDHDGPIEFARLGILQALPRRNAGLLPGR